MTTPAESKTHKILNYLYEHTRDRIEAGKTITGQPVSTDDIADALRMGKDGFQSMLKEYKRCGYVITCEAIRGRHRITLWKIGTAWRPGLIATAKTPSPSGEYKPSPAPSHRPGKLTCEQVPTIRDFKPQQTETAQPVVAVVTPATPLPPQIPSAEVGSGDSSIHEQHATELQALLANITDLKRQLHDAKQLIPPFDIANHAMSLQVLLPDGVTLTLDRDSAEVFHQALDRTFKCSAGEAGKIIEYCNYLNSKVAA